MASDTCHKQMDNDRATADSGTARCPRTISAAQLFDGAREIIIEHAGRPYHLRLTSRNKLILVA